MNIYHVTCDKNKKIVKANIENICEKIEAAFYICIEKNFFRLGLTRILKFLKKQNYELYLLGQVRMTLRIFLS